MKKLLHKRLLAISLLIISANINLYAQTTWNGVSWSSGLPNSTIDVIIASSTIVGSNFSCKNLTINSGITMNMKVGYSWFVVYGDLTNNGNGISTPGYVRFYKNGTATLIGNAIAIDGIITIGSSTTLSTNGLLTLTATSASSFGQLVGIGTVSGNVHVEKYIDPTTPHYFHLGSPCTNAKLDEFNEWNTMLSSSGSNGTVWEWNSSASTWDAPGDISTTTATNGKGYSFYAGTNASGTFIRSTAGTISVSGSIVTTDVNVPLSYHNGQGGSITFAGAGTIAETEGWNLIANPYTSAYNWDWQTLPTDVSSTIYRFDGTNYSSYVKGAGGGSEFIDPFDGFFVQLTSNTPGNFTFDEDNRNPEKEDAAKTALYIIDGIDLHIKNNSGTVNDQLFIGYDKGASINFDNAYDGRKLLNVAGVPNIYTEQGGSYYSVNRIHPNDNITSFPIFLEHATNGESMVFNLDMSRFQSYATVKIEDLKTGNIHNIGNSDYYFVHDASFKNDRFVLHFSSKQAVGIEDLNLTSAWFTYNDENGVNVNLGELEEAKVEVFNISGQLITTVESKGSNLVQIPLNKGIYIIKVTTANDYSMKKILF